VSEYPVALESENPPTNPERAPKAMLSELTGAPGPT